MAGPPPPSWRPTFTQAQLDAYLSYIGLADISPPQSPTTTQQLPFLTTLIRHTLCKIPFENLDLHYSTVKGVSLDPTHLFHKIVERRAGRGGYCMQNNSFFGQVLRSLGYTVISLGARVASSVTDGTAGLQKPEDVGFKGYGHYINLVIIEGKKYFCDVGFGSAGPTGPVPLEDGFERVNTGTEGDVATTMKVVRGYVANNTERNEEQKLWQYWIKYGRGDDGSKNWAPCYCFSETEFFPFDYDVMNCWVSTDRKSPFVNRVICQKFVMGEDGESLVGDVTLSDTDIKERRFGKSKVLAEIKSEKDRTDALEKYMGVVLSQPEKMGIMGFPTMIRG